ncbi:MAG: MTH1187 family thiamine-binding protein [Paenibacillaceae bacterium]|nr:MTH1187 family thiamine-binding protein [Paenibacillaceae bacterium]
MPIMEITVVPLGTATTSISAYVADLHRLLDDSGLPIRFEMSSMSTVVEGKLEHLFAVARQLHEAPFHRGAQRVSTSLRIDDRRDKDASMASKLQSVRDKLEQDKPASPSY